MERIWNINPKTGWYPCSVNVHQKDHKSLNSRIISIYKERHTKYTHLSQGSVWCNSCSALHWWAQEPTRHVKTNHNAIYQHNYVNGYAQLIQAIFDLLLITKRT